MEKPLNNWDTPPSRWCRPVFQLFLLVRPSENQHRTPTTGLEGGKQTTVIENSHGLFQGAKNSRVYLTKPTFSCQNPSASRCPQRVELINGGLSLGGATWESMGRSLNGIRSCGNQFKREHLINMKSTKTRKS